MWFPSLNDTFPGFRLQKVLQEEWSLSLETVDFIITCAVAAVLHVLEIVAGLKWRFERIFCCFLLCSCIEWFH